MLAELRKQGASLLLTTHQLEEAEARCDRIVVIDHGRVGRRRARSPSWSARTVGDAAHA